MFAMVLRETRPIEENPLVPEDVPVPEIAPDEMLIRVKACGVCHTDLQTVEGDLALPKLPLIPGHQVVGCVITPPESRRFAPGDRVGITSYHSSCGVCRFCLEGRENLCDSASFIGLHRDGGYAEYMIVNENSAFVIHGQFSDAEATPLLCGGVVGYRALKMVGIKSGQNLGLYGFGSSAHIVMQIAISRGIKVSVFTRSSNHIASARELGAVWVGAANDESPGLMDGSIIFAPAGDLVPKALGALQKGGTLALTAGAMSPIPELDFDLISGERSIKSVAKATRKDAEDLLQTAASIELQTVVESFPLNEANAVLTMLKTGYLRAGAVLIP